MSYTSYVRKQKDAFDEAKLLEARWAELHREQREVHQVCYHAESLRPLDPTPTNKQYSDSRHNSS